MADEEKKIPTSIDSIGIDDAMDTTKAFTEAMKDQGFTLDELYAKFKTFESIVASSNMGIRARHTATKQLLEELKKESTDFKSMSSALSLLGEEGVNIPQELEGTVNKFLGGGGKDAIDRLVGEISGATSGPYQLLGKQLENIASKTSGMGSGLSSALDTLESISDKIKNIEDVGKGLGSGFFEDISLSRGGIADIHGSVKDIGVDMSGVEERFNAVDGAVNQIKNSLGDKKIKIFGKNLDMSEAISKAQTLVDDLQSKLEKVNEELEKSPTDLVSTMKQLVSSSESLGEGAMQNIPFDKIQDELEKFISGQSDSLDESHELVKSLHNADSAVASQIAGQIAYTKELKNTASVHKGLINSMSEEMKAAEATRGYFLQMRGAAENVRNSVLSTLSILPGWIQNLVGVGKISATLSESMDSGMKAAMVAFNEGEGVIGKLRAAAGKFKESFARGFTAALGPLAIAAAVIAGILAVTMMLGNTISGISEDLGVSKDQALKLHKGMERTAVSSKASLLTTKEIMEVQKKHVEQTGKLLDLNDANNRQMVQFASNMSNAYGTGIADVYNMMHEFQEIGADREMSEQLTQWVGKAAELNDIPFDTIAKDLAQAAEFVAMHFSGMPKDAARAAVEIRKMGLSLEQAGKIYDKMLNVDSFMGDMHELAAMSDADLSVAFNMRMTGEDPAKVMDEVMKEYDNLSSSMKDNEFVAKKFADTLGMTVKELRASEKIRRFSRDLSEEELGLVKEHMNSLSEQDLANQENLKSKAEELATQKQLSAQMDRIKTQLSEALLPLAQIFADVFSQLMPVFDIIGVALKFVGTMLRLAAPLIQAVLKPFMGIALVLEEIVEWLSWGVDTLSEWISPVQDTEDALWSVGSTINWIKNLIFGMAALWSIGMLGPFKSVVSKMYAPILKLFGMKGLGSKILSFGGDLGSRFSKSFGSSLQKGLSKLNPTKLMGRLKEGIMGKAYSGGQFMKGGGRAKAGGQRSGGIIGRAKSLFMGKDKSQTKADPTKAVNSFWGNFSKMLTKIKDSAAGILKSIGNAIGNFFKSIVDAVKKIKTADMVRAAASILILSGALYVTAKAVKEFNGVEWEDLGKAGAALGGLALVAIAIGQGSNQMMRGAIAIAILGASLIPLAYALSLMENVEWSALGMLGTALVGLAVSAGILGAIMMSGVGAAAILLGAAAIAVLGTSLIPLAAALNIAAPAMEDFGVIIKSTFEGMATVIDSVADGLTSVLGALTLDKAAAITAVALALPLLSVGLLALAGAQLGQGIASFFTGDPIEKLERLASIDASSIISVGDSLNMIADALERIRDIDFDAAFSVKMEKFATFGSSISAEAKNISETATSVESADMEGTSETNVSNVTQTEIAQPQIKADFQPLVRATNDIYKQNTVNNSESQNINTKQLEYLMKKLIKTVQENSLKDVPIVIDKKTGRQLNSFLKNFN